MEYNTTRSKLLMPEYWRDVQKMVEYLLMIEDSAKLLSNVEAVISFINLLIVYISFIEYIVRTMYSISKNIIEGKRLLSINKVLANNSYN